MSNAVKRLRDPPRRVSQSLYRSGGYHCPMLRHIPFIRLGLLVVVAAVFVSLINFYIGVGSQLADFAADDLATEPRDLLEHFTNNFLFAGTYAGIGFWLGIALCTIGIVRNLTVGRRPRTHS
jgi:hypothetical protein